MRALRQRASEPLRFSGVGGREMAAAGLVSLLPMDDFAIIGFSAIPGRLPRIVSHMARTVAPCWRARPHALVIIDSPDFTLRVARFVRAVRPLDPDHRLRVAIGLGVAGGARACDAALMSTMSWRCCRSSPTCIGLGGPPCSYVGHPLIEEVSKLRPYGTEVERRLADPPPCAADIVLGHLRRGGGAMAARNAKRA